jgi:nicotinamide phosphoribosyltransferase
VYSNLTPRSDKIYLKNCTKFYDGKLVFVGAQGAVQEIMEMWDEFFDLPRIVAVSVFVQRMAVYLGGEVEASAQIAALHDLGYLPLEIKALPEGSKVKMGIPVMTITNTKPAFFWLTNYLETVLSDLTWKTATNATIAAEYKAICKHYAELTGTDDFTVSIQCHDFSMRGMSGPEDAARAGFAHLTSFIGTDTLPAMDYAEDYYDADPNGLIAISVPATEHAVATSNILVIEDEITHKWEVNDPNVRLVSEQAFMKDLITQKFPTGIVSYVADSFDFWAVLTDILPNLKDVILARQPTAVAPGKLVIRPDSGDPVKIICGYNVVDAEAEVLNSNCDLGEFYELGYDFIRVDGEYYEIEDIGFDKWNERQMYEAIKVEISDAEVKGAIQVLWEVFGGTQTATGYNLLDSHIGLIYGDSITTKRAEEILRRLADKGFASGNVVFGVGSYTYQCNTRDTFGFAVKATYTEVNGEGIAIFKDPKTDSKKKSAKGLLMVVNTGKELVLVDNVDTEQEATGELKTIFKDGKFVKRTTLEEIRQRLA